MDLILIEIKLVEHTSDGRFTHPPLRIFNQLPAQHILTNPLKTPNPQPIPTPFLLPPHGILKKLHKPSNHSLALEAPKLAKSIPQISQSKSHTLPAVDP